MRATIFISALAAVTRFASALSSNDDVLEDLPTQFNGIQVPPLPELTGKNFDETVSNGYWFVKYYSPTCPHCNAIKQHWQTLYEFYTTSLPLYGQVKDAQPDQFHKFYNFHFASVNCQAAGDLCSTQKIDRYPTFLLYKDGAIVTKFDGDRTMEIFSQFVEEMLEKIKPGSRPRGGIKVPAPGAKSIERGGTKTGELLAHETARLNKKPPSKSGALPNPHGTSVPLTAESFQKLVTNTQDSWFVKFYAPWCQHCQHLAPTWAQMARELENKLNVGEVNCDQESRLCKDAKVSAYPTIHFFRGGERVEFEGLRGLGDLLAFATRAVDSDVKYVDAAAFVELERTEEVIFTYFFDHATTSEDFAALDRLTLSLIGHAKLVKTDSEELAKRFKIHTWPRLLVVRSGRPTFFTPFEPYHMRDFRKVLSWMQSVWLPIVPELTAANAKEIMNGKFAVLGVLHRDHTDQFVQSKNELKNAALEWMDKVTLQFQLERQELREAKQLRIEEAEDRDDQRALRQAKSRVVSISEDEFRKQVRFAWVDGVFWERWLKSTYGIDMTQGERVIIADEDNRRFWDLTDTGNFITPSRTSILETLPRICDNPPRLTPKSTVGLFEGMIFHIRHMPSRHPFLLAGFILSVTIMIYAFFRHGSPLRLMRGNGNGFLSFDEKNGLLGGNNGKKE